MSVEIVDRDFKSYLPPMIWISFVMIRQLIRVPTATAEYSIPFSFWLNTSVFVELPSITVSSVIQMTVKLKRRVLALAKIRASIVARRTMNRVLFLKVMVDTFLEAEENFGCCILRLLIIQCEIGSFVPYLRERVIYIIWEAGSSDERLHLTK